MKDKTINHILHMKSFMYEFKRGIKMATTDCVNGVKLCGKFDENLNHISSNYAMQNFIGDNLMHSMYRIVHSGDAEKVEGMLRRCRAGNECMEIVRLLSQDDVFINFIFRAKYDEANREYSIEMSNADENNSILDNLGREIRSLRAYITLENDVLLNYNHKTKVIKLFIVSDKMDVTLYEKRIDTWQEQMISSGYIMDDQDKTVFQQMCSDIKNKTPKKTYQFRSSIIRKGEQIDYNKVTISPIAEDDGVIETVGRWTILSAVDGEPVDDFCVDTYIDPLTELLNKKSITDYAKEAVTSGNNERVAFAMLDLDNFKAVNDTYGHLFGDEVLKTVGKIIKDAVSGIAVAGRMGGDEFFIVFKDYVDELHLRNALRTIKINIVAYFHDKMGDIQLSCSIGAARSDKDYRDYYKLFKVADKALYIVKQKGKNRYIIYKTELHGQFMADDSQTQVEMKSSYYDENDIHDIGHWMKMVLVNGKGEIPAMLEHMAKAFHLDRVGIYINSGNVSEYEYRKPGVVPGNGTLIQNKKYLDLFQDEALVVENVNTIEYSVPECYKLLSSTDCKSFVQVLIKDLNDEVVGLISFDICNSFVTFPSRVVENIKTYGNFLAGIMI